MSRHIRHTTTANQRHAGTFYSFCGHYFVIVDVIP